MGGIILSCGHEDSRKPLGWMLYSETWECDAELGFQKGLLSGSYCTHCFCANILRDPESVWTSYAEAQEAIFGKVS